MKKIVCLNDYYFEHTCGLIQFKPYLQDSATFNMALAQMAKMIETTTFSIIYKKPYDAKKMIAKDAKYQSLNGLIYFLN